jgi:hypothetical protein
MTDEISVAADVVVTDVEAQDGNLALSLNLTRKLSISDV